MTKIAPLLIFILLSFTCWSQEKEPQNFHLTISPVIVVDKDFNKEIISALSSFLQTKNLSLTENLYWQKSDFDKFIYPYLDIYNIEHSRHGKDFFQPMLMEIIDTKEAKKKIVKIAYLGYNPASKDNMLRTIYNLVATQHNGEIKFSKYLTHETANWEIITENNFTYYISPGKKANLQEVEKQKKEIEQLCKFLNTTPLPITYYSCKNPIELFRIKGFDYNTMMFADTSGGLAEHGNIVFSGNNSEYYTHEIAHVYTANLFPQINKFLDEGFATLVGGSGVYNYAWHRNKLQEYLRQNPGLDVAQHTDAYERFYIEKGTPVPYIVAALICERTLRKYGKEKLFELFRSTDDLWITLKQVGLTKHNLNKELRKEIEKVPVNFL